MLPGGGGLYRRKKIGSLVENDSAIELTFRPRSNSFSEVEPLLSGSPHSTALLPVHSPVLPGGEVELRVVNTNGGWVEGMHPEGWGMPAGEPRGRPAANSNTAYMIIAAIGVVGIALAVFEGITRRHGGSGGSSYHAANPNTGNALAASGEYSGYVHELLGYADPDGGWTGGAATSRTGQNAVLRDLVSQKAATDQGARAVVQTQARQVNSGKGTLGNVLNGLGLAIPVAEALWYAGPAGPALSYQFQLATANSAVGSSADTVSTMHDNAEQNGAQLDALAQQYGAMHQRLTAVAGARYPR